MLHDEEKLQLLQTLLESPALGDSARLKDLLRYLVTESIKGNRPKETSIAIDVLGKGSDFDPKLDAIVRVYVNNLRHKLESYYHSDAGKLAPFHINIPKGSYEIEFIPVLEQQNNTTNKPHWILYGSLALLLVVNVIVLFLYLNRNTPLARNNKILNPIIDRNNKQTLLVLGDFFVMNDLQEGITFHNNVRNVKINNIEDFLLAAKENPEFNKRFSPGLYTYLRPSATLGTVKLLPYLQTSEFGYQTKLASQLTVEDFKAFNVIYIGQVKSLNIIRRFIETYGLYFDPVKNTLSYRVHKSDSLKMLTSTKIQGGKYENDLSMIIRGNTAEGSEFLLLLGFAETGVLGSVESLFNPLINEKIVSFTEGRNGKQQKTFTVIMETEGVNQTIFKTSFKEIMTPVP